MKCSRRFSLRLSHRRHLKSALCGIIREIEPRAWHIHTGAIGFMTPRREMFFNVAIRTLLLRGDIGEMGVGGGIVWDSTPESEYAECQIKSDFLRCGV